MLMNSLTASRSKIVQCGNLNTRKVFARIAALQGGEIRHGSVFDKIGIYANGVVLGEINFHACT